MKENDESIKLPLEYPVSSQDAKDVAYVETFLSKEFHLFPNSSHVILNVVTSSTVGNPAGTSYLCPSDILKYPPDLLSPSPSLYLTSPLFLLW